VSAGYNLGAPRQALLGDEGRGPPGRGAGALGGARPSGRVDDLRASPACRCVRPEGRLGAGGG
jgi:hypothetical protein